MIFKRLNLTFTRPTYTLAEADLEKQEQFRKKFKTVKKLEDDQIQHVLFCDESMIRDYQAIDATWFEKGKQKIIKTYGKHRGVKLVGCLDYENSGVFCEEHEIRANVHAFLSDIAKKPATAIDRLCVTL